MIGIHIVCSYDGVPLAETLMRLLEAEEHAVRLSYGRGSANDLDAAKASKHAVLLIWSADAPGQHYMKEWARQIPEHRLVEIASAAGWPKSERKAPVIDFTAWRGTRGARAWNALTERLRQMQRAIEPQRSPPKRAALALGLASLAAVSGAIMVRVNQGAPTIAAPDGLEPQSIALIEDPSVGVGGPLSAIEPASADELTLVRLSPNPHVALLDAGPPPDLMELPAYEPPAIRDPTLVERIGEFNPLRRDGEAEEN
ncbi:MAG TPA: hypothetical protein VEA80_12280 [Vitreimonas sp.]|uniref:hypothetical protein n=1 Tax=Vitreimonas sp. TaxID=3069702 RepID=UPI002D41ABBC|nr:hypothetical protein [Vitreimonas sp.]HYD88248.1 hypothetical protein [Vitreimonas sp.]